MRVAHVITRMIIGGAQENTLFTVQGLRETGEYELVDLITGPTLGPEGHLLEHAGFREGQDYILVPDMVRNIHPLKDIRAFFSLLKLFKEKKYDVVHTHSSKAGILGRLAAKAAGVRFIVHTVHGLPFHEYEAGWLNAIYVFLERLCARVSARIVTVCRVMQEKALAKKVGRKDQYVTIYSGMDLEPFLLAGRDREAMRQRLGIREGEVVIGKIARLFHLKGHDYLLDAVGEAVKENRGLRVLLVGDGILKDSLEKKAANLGIREAVVFAGLVMPEEIPRYIAAMDILVHVSLREGLARALPQALAAGVPVISFDIDGAREVVENGEDGYLVEAGDTAMLKDAILTLAKDRDFRERLGKYGKLKVDPIFRREYMVRKIDDLYKELAEHDAHHR